MAETTARQLIFSALIFTAIITGCFVIIGGFVPDGDINSTSDYGTYNRSYAKFAAIREDSEEIQSKMQTVQPEEGTINLGILDGLVRSSWGAISLTWRSVTTMTSIISNLSSDFGLPIWFTGLLITIIIVTIAFAIIAAIFKWYI